MPSYNQQTTEAAEDESPFQQVIPSLSQQSLYPSLAAMGTTINTSISPSIPFSRRVINDIEEHQRRALDDSIGGTIRGTNTSPVPAPEEQEEEVITPNTKLQAGIIPAETQEETLQLESLETQDTSNKQVHTIQDQDSKPLQAQNIGKIKVIEAQDTIDTQIQDDGTDSQHNDEEPDLDIPDDQTSKASQEDNYCTGIDDDEQDDTIQFGNPITQPFLSRNIRVPTTEVDCLSFIQMLQDYLHAYLPPSQVDAYSPIHRMAQWLDMYLNRYPAQYINCMTSDSEFVAFVNHAIQLALDLTTYSNIWAVLLILLETQHVNTSYVQVMHNYYNQCYNTRTEKYMIGLEKVAEQLKNTMYDNTLDGVSAHVQQPVCNPSVQSTDQHDANAKNCTELPNHAHFNDILTEYPAWSTDTNDIENSNEAQYRLNKQDILNVW